MNSISQTVLGTQDFRLLWLGEAISALGDQFALVALPWLALVLTGSALTLGSVLAIMAIPRALLMLVGGVYVDRLSPRRVMLVSNAVRLFAVGALGLIVLAGGAGLWGLYGLALIFGVADAFFFPAQNSIVPALVTEAQLQQANGIIQGTGQLAVFVGPALAGIVIAGLRSGGASPGLSGIAAALLVDAISFLVSLVTLLAIRGGSDRNADNESVVESIKQGIGFVWNSPTLRFAVLIVMAINTLVVGPFDVGVPMIAYTRLPGGAEAYGTLMSALGGGSLLGMVVATAVPGLRPAAFGTVVMAILSLTGVGLASLATVQTLQLALGLTAVIGLATGYGNLMLITWAQQRIPRSHMGRVVSLVGLGTMGLIPVSQVIAGAAVQLSLTAMLTIAGGLMALITLASIATGTVRRMGFVPTVGEMATRDGQKIASDTQSLPG
jgi:MFS family permease